jgi:NTE family protein
MIPQRILLCGGGVNVTAHLGVLDVLEQKGTLRHVKEWMGVSAGAFLAMSLSIGVTLAELTAFNLEFDFTLLTDPDTAPGWFLNLGYDTGSKLTRVMEAFLREKGLPPTVTFGDLAAKGHKGLRVFAANINTGTLKEFSAHATPGYSVANAVRASMTIPYYYQPFKCPDTGHIYYDGGVISNYPIQYLSDADARNTLGVLFTHKIDTVEHLELKDILLRPIQIALRSRTILDKFQDQTIVVPLGSRSSVHFEITKEEKMALIDLGRVAATTFLSSLRKKPVRRYSVS